MGNSKWNAEEVGVGIGTVYNRDSEVRKLIKASSSLGETDPVTFLNWRDALILCLPFNFIK